MTAYVVDPTPFTPPPGPGPPYTTLVSVSLGVVPAGSLHHSVPSVGQVPLCGRPEPGSRPTWLDRSVAPPPLSFAPRPGPIADPRRKGAWTDGGPGNRHSQANAHRCRGLRTRPQARRADDRDEQPRSPGPRGLG